MEEEESLRLSLSIPEPSTMAIFGLGVLGTANRPELAL